MSELFNIIQQILNTRPINLSVRFCRISDDYVEAKQIMTSTAKLWVALEDTTEYLNFIKENKNSEYI